jgi:hypothetical protein
MKRNIPAILLLSFFLINSSKLFSQFSSLDNTFYNSDLFFEKDTLSYSSISEEDSLFVKKRFWRASGELMLAQVIPWAYNYFVRDAEFAHISWESIGYNLDFSHWEWDDNTFQTNQFAHPYQGSMYFSAFRSNGYNFWQSAPAALVGSYMWEVAGETHPPAPNDLINTTLGGISVGEMTYRISNLIVNNRQTGFKRQVNEVLAFIVNPMNGLNRIIDGKWGRISPNAADRVPGYLGGTLDIGYRRFSENINDVFTKGNNEFMVRVKLQYGNPYEEFEKPFSNFNLTCELGASDSATLNNLQFAGSLFGNTIKDDEKVQRVVVITMNYDYIKNTSIQFGAQSFNLKLMANHKYGENTNLFTEIGIIGVALASVPDDYLYYGEGRNYDFGPGAGLLLGGLWNLKNKFHLGLNYKGVWFNTIDGNESNFFLNTAVLEGRYFFSPFISMSLQSGYIVQNSYYDDFDDVVSKYPFGRIALGYTLGSKQ